MRRHQLLEPRQLSRHQPLRNQNHHQGYYPHNKVAVVAPTIINDYLHPTPLPEDELLASIAPRVLWTNPIRCDYKPPLMVDSGAATHCCPLWFGSEIPLQPVSEYAPPLASASNTPITTHGERWIGLKLKSGNTIALQMIVRNVTVPILSTAKMGSRGNQLTNTREEVCETESGEKECVLCSIG